MTTRATQIDFLLSGLIDPSTSAPLTGGTAYFYEAGTNTAKNVWTEKEKTNAYSSVTLSTGGVSQIYGDGIYKIVVKDSSGSTVFTWDNVKIRAHNFSVVTKIADYTTTADDDVILANTSSNDITLTMLASASMEYPLIVNNYTGSNDVIVDPNASETIDGSPSLTIAAGGYAYIFSDGSNLRTAFGANILTFANTGLRILDTDASHYLTIAAGSDLSANRTFTLTTGDAARTLTMDGDATIDQDLSVDANPQFAGLNDGTYDIDIPTNGMAAAKFMLGDSNTIIWFYLNAAPPGWKVLATGADSTLAISGGTGAWNINGGNIAGTAFDDLEAHTHTYTDVVTHVHPAEHGNFVTTDGGTKNVPGGATFGISDSYTGAPAGAVATGTTDASNITEARPTAAVGKLFQLDTA